MQQLVAAGRNEPCPCGSGRKFKKCCLEAHAAAITGDAAQLDVAALVDQAIETDDWAPMDPHVDRALEAFERGGPLEHVRFRLTAGTSHEPDRFELAKLCTAGWLGQCQLALARVLDQFELEPEVRDGLRLAAHLLRRFGARSPIVEELAELQARECAARVRRVRTALSASGLTTEMGPADVAELVSWLARVRPPILGFPDWFALRVTPDDAFVTVWSCTVKARVSDVCLDRLEAGELADRRSWAHLAALTCFCTVPRLGEELVTTTPLRTPTADELAIYEALEGPPAGDRPLGRMQDVIRETEARGDFTGAALLRETMRALQHEHR